MSTGASAVTLCDWGVCMVHSTCG